MSSWGSYGRSSRSAASFTVILFGLAGAAASAALWLRQIAPGSQLMRFMSRDVFANTQGWTALVLVAAVCGGVALLLALVGSIGSRSAGGGAVVGFVLAMLALSYPFAYMASMVARPFSGGGPFH